MRNLMKEYLNERINYRNCASIPARIVGTIAEVSNARRFNRRNLRRAARHLRATRRAERNASRIRRNAAADRQRARSSSNSRLRQASHGRSHKSRESYRKRRAGRAPSRRSPAMFADDHVTTRSPPKCVCLKTRGAIRKERRANGEIGETNGFNDENNRTRESGDCSRVEMIWADVHLSCRRIPLTPRDSSSLAEK